MSEEKDKMARQPDGSESTLQGWFREHQGLIAAGDLSAGVVHEARNVLTGVLGMVQIVRRRNLDDAKREEWMERIEAETRRCVEKLNCFLQVPRAEDRTLVDVDLNDAVGRAAALAKHSLEMQRVQLIVELGTDLPIVRASVETLRQVVVNLLLNAMQAMPDGGIVRLSSGVDGDNVFVSVQDNGPGIPEHLRERVFEPLFTTKPAGEGTGLGLPYCRDAAVALGGSLVLQEAHSGGAEFILRLPRDHTPEPTSDEGT